jgi:hypothetical protein
MLLTQVEQEQAARSSGADAAKQRALEVSRNEAKHLALRPHIERMEELAATARPHWEAIAGAAQSLAVKAQPHVDAFAHTAQGLAVKAKPHFEAAREATSKALSSSVQGLTERAAPNLEGLASSAAEATASVESVRQWCWQQVGCDLERDSPGHYDEGIVAREDATFLAPPSEEMVSGSPEAAAATEDGLPTAAAAAPAAGAGEAASLPPPAGLHFATAQLLEDKRNLFAHRNPTLLTNRAFMQPDIGFKPSVRSMAAFGIQ